MEKKRLIPFRLLPGSWGLQGKVYDEAEAYYLLEGEALDRRLLAIRYDADQPAFKEESLKLDLKYKKITEYDYEIAMLAFQHHADPLASLGIALKFGRLSVYDYDKGVAASKPAGIDRELALLEVEFKHDKISGYEYDCQAVALTVAEGLDRQLAILELDYKHDKLDRNAYEKARANLLEEPWIGIVGQGFEPDKGVNGVYFEFDWNEHWIEYLRLNGYTGYTDQMIVDLWFADVCKANAPGPNYNVAMAAEGLPNVVYGKRNRRDEPAE